MNDFVEIIPKRVCFLIFSQLELSSIGKSVVVCKNWRNLLEDEEFWKYMCMQNGAQNTQVSHFRYKKLLNQIIFIVQQND